MNGKIISSSTGMTIALVIVLIGVTGFVYTIKATADQAVRENEIQDVVLKTYGGDINILKEVVVNMAANISIICGEISKNCINK